MPKIVKELSDAEVRRLKSKKKKPTYHAVGGRGGRCNAARLCQVTILLRAPGFCASEVG